MIQMAAPPRRIFALPEAFSLGRVQNLFDPAAHPRCSLGLRCPNRFQDREHVVGADGANRLVLQRRGVSRQRRLPLVLVLRVAETHREAFTHLIGELPERGAPPVRLRSAMGSRPCAIIRRAWAAFSRASERETVAGTPRPIS